MKIQNKLLRIGLFLGILLGFCSVAFALDIELPDGSKVKIINDFAVYDQDYSNRMRFEEQLIIKYKNLGFSTTNRIEEDNDFHDTYKIVSRNDLEYRFWDGYSFVYEYYYKRIHTKTIRTQNLDRLGISYVWKSKLFNNQISMRHKFIYFPYTFQSGFVDTDLFDMINVIDHKNWFLKSVFTKSVGDDMDGPYLEILTLGYKLTPNFSIRISYQSGTVVQETIRGGIGIRF